MPSGTVVITDTDKAIPPKDNPISLDKKAQTPSKKGKTPKLNNGEIPEALAKLSIFAAPNADSDSNKNNPKAKLYQRVRSVKGALLRGDYNGSGRNKPKDNRPAVADINWEAPAL